MRDQAGDDVADPVGERVGEPASWRVREATVDDATEIARVHLASHRETYSATGRIPAEVIEAWSVEGRTDYWGRVAQAAARGEHAVVVAEAGDEIVGFAHAAPSLDEDRFGHWSLAAIYLLEAYQGSGLGQALIDAALGGRAASLWVLADNPRAHAFYARNGFRPDGAEKLDERWGSVPEVRLSRP